MLAISAASALQRRREEARVTLQPATGQTERKRLASGVVFDLDGTLVDSAPDLAEALNQFFVRRKLGPFDLASVRAMVGGGVQKLLERSWTALGKAQPRDMRAQVYEFIAIYGARPTKLSKPFSGAHDAIVSLRNEGFAIGLCTNKPEAIARRMLADFGWTPLFDAVIGGDTTQFKKPHPAPLALALARMGVFARKAVMVGDSGADVGAAASLGLRSVLVSYGYSRIPVGELGADALIDDLRALPAVIEGFGMTALA